MSERRHAKRSPSGAWKYCAARVVIPGLPSGPAAELGTKLHYLALDYWLTEYLKTGVDPIWLPKLGGDDEN